MKYGSIIFNHSLFILLSQFVAIHEKAFYVSFYKEKQSESLLNYVYQRYTLSIKKSDICLWVFKYTSASTNLAIFIYSANSTITRMI